MGAGATHVKVKFNANEIAYQLDIDVRSLLVDILRDEMSLTSVHVGCGTGHCGACTVLVDGEPVKSCLILAVEVEDSNILTIEGLAPIGRLHPIQASFIRSQALQCGFCTPAVILNVFAFLKENKDPTDSEIRSRISGNLCRCTGYNFICEAIGQAALDMREIALREQDGASGGEPSGH